MATITKRRRGDGSFGYTAQIRLKRSGKIAHSEAQTFDRAAQAEAWGRAREAQLAQPGALQKAVGGDLSLADLIGKYIEAFEDLHRWRRSKRTHLDFLRRQPIGQAAASSITAPLLVDHVRSRRMAGAGPSTVLNDLVWIGVVLKAGKHVFHLPVDAHAADDAKLVCQEHRLIAKPQRRDRRPTADELKRLTEWFQRTDGRREIPMADVMWFAIYSGRRQEEITLLRWADLNRPHATILVRDVKHPTAKDGNHRLSRMTREGLNIILQQPKGELIFPYDPRSISAAFTRACKMLGIVGLTFHDLRHEATSRLFERGYEIHEVQLFTLHENWATLKRYTQLKPHQLKTLPELSASRSGRPGRPRRPARATSASRNGKP